MRTIKLILEGIVFVSMLVVLVGAGFGLYFSGYEKAAGSLHPYANIWGLIMLISVSVIVIYMIVEATGDIMLWLTLRSKRCRNLGGTDESEGRG